MMIGSVIVSAVCCVAGLLLSTLSDVPCSAIIVAIMAGAFFAGRILKPLFSR